MPETKRLYRPQCQVCHCRTYEDEAGSYCQDCRALCERLSRQGASELPRKLSAAEKAERERRIAEHQRRVERYEAARRTP